MNKKELITQIAGRMGIPQMESHRFINVLCDIVSEELQRGNDIALQNFGSFNLWQQSERLGRNPKNGLPTMIHARKSVKFKPGKGLLDSLNKR